MKRKISILLLAALAVQCAPTAFAANASITAKGNEAYHEYDVTMTVKNNVINTSTEKLFGFNMEWNNGDMVKSAYLDKNYAKSEKFANDFEDEKYYAVPMQTADAYFTASTKTKSKYIANGDTFGGMLSSTRYMVKDGTDFYPNQYDAGGDLQNPAGNLDRIDNYVMAEPIKENMTIGGDGFIGYNSDWYFATDYNGRDIEDMTVVTDPQNAQNHTAKFAPAKDKVSYYGKNRVAIMDRATKTSYNIMIASDSADVRLGIAKDWNFEHIADTFANRYITGATQFAKVYYYTQPSAWFDAVRFKNGKIYLAGNEVGTYEKDTWYTVEYTLNTGDAPFNALTVSSGGNTVIDTEANIILNKKKNMCADVPDIANNVSEDFNFAENSVYGIMLSAYGDDAKMTAYADDLSFETVRYYDKKDNVIDQKFGELRDNYAFPYTRMAGTSANSFNWKKSVGNAETRERFNRDPRKSWNEANEAYADVNPYGITKTEWGLPEWLKFVDYMNPDAEYSYVININDTDEDIAELIEYLVGTGDITGDGVDWSAQRKADGIDRKARVSMWEISNEPYLMTTDEHDSVKMTVEEFLERAGQVVKILKRYAPDIPIGIPTNDYGGEYLSTRNPEDYKSQTWTDDIVAQDWIKDCGYIVYHSYQTNYNSYPLTAPKNIEYWIKSDISKNKNLKIAYTEHGTGQPGSRQNYYKGIGLCSAIDEAVYFNKIFLNPTVERANLHCYSLSTTGGWSVGYEKDGRYVAGASYHLMDMYAKNAVGDVLETDIDGFAKEIGSALGYDGWEHGTVQDWKEGKYGYTCSAVKQADGSVNLFISNQRNHKLNLNLVMDEAFDDYEICEKQVITGKAEDTLFSYDGTANIPIAKSTDASGNDIYTYEAQYCEDMVYETDYDTRRGNVEISPYSVTMLKLKKSGTRYVTASWNGEERVDISGKINRQSQDEIVTLMITDKTDGDVIYINDTELDKDGAFRFNFLLGKDIADCDVKIRYAGSVKNIGGEFEELTDSADLFGITAQITPSGVTAFVNNKYNFLNVWFTAAASGYKSFVRETAEGMSLSAKQHADDGETAVILSEVPGSNAYRLYFWDSMNGMEPIFGAMAVSK